MRRLFSVLGSVLFFIAAPGTVAGLVPWWISRWQIQAPLLGRPFIRVVGILLTAAGIAILLDSFARFALQGLATPAPVFPTRRLVISGFYRYVRNPMYLAVLAAIVGQGLLLGSLSVLEYGALVWLGFHLFVIAYEHKRDGRNHGLAVPLLTLARASTIRSR